MAACTADGQVPEPPTEGEGTVTGRAVRALLPALGLGAAYTVAILVGRSTRVEGSEISLVWPAAAVAEVAEAPTIRPAAIVTATSAVRLVFFIFWGWLR